MPFNYSPAVSDQRAAIISNAAPVIAENLRRGFDSLGETLRGLKAKHDELKAKKALAEAFTAQLGGDPKAVEKMKMPQLDAFLTLAPMRIEQSRQQQQTKIMGTALQGMLNRQSPETPSGAIGTAPAAGQDMGQQFTAMISRAASAGANPDTLNTLANLGKTVSAMYSRGMTVDPATGLRMFNGRLLPASTQKLLGFGGGGSQPPTMQFTPGPGGTSFWNFGNRAGEVRPNPPATRPESFGLGPFPKGTTFSTENGIRIATTPDGSMHVLPGGGGVSPDDVRAEVDRISGGGTPGEGSSSATSESVFVKDKDGNLFTLPKAQLEDAKKQGYVQVNDEKGTE